MCRQFENAFGMGLERAHPKRWKIFDEMDNVVLLVEINQVQREKQSERMNPLGRDDPKTFVRSELEFSNQPLEAQKDRIGSLYIQAEETFARLVVNAIGFHLYHWPLGFGLCRRGPSF